MNERHPDFRSHRTQCRAAADRRTLDKILDYLAAPDAIHVLRLSIPVCTY